MGAAIVAGIEAGWVNPVINKVLFCNDHYELRFYIVFNSILGIYDGSSSSSSS